MKIIAHRGASGEFAENSLLAFEQAIFQGCDGIEFDAQFHQPSGEYILLHDSYLKIGACSDEHSNDGHNSDKKIHFNQLSLAEIVNTSTPTKDNICTLNQALQCINQQCLINIELKSAAQGDQLAVEMQKLEQIIQQAQRRKLITYQQIIISSFNHHALIHIAERLPNVNTAALIACCPIDYAKFCQKLKVKYLNLSIECLNPEIINDAHLRGLKIWVYTVDNPAQIKQCFEHHVDGIFTNFPQRSREIVLTL